MFLGLYVEKTPLLLQKLVKDQYKLEMDFNYSNVFYFNFNRRRMHHRCIFPYIVRYSVLLVFFRKFRRNKLFFCCRWTRFFYGTMDEVIGPEDGVPTPIIDTSIARDRGLFSWIWATMRIKLVICIIVIFVFHFSI